MNNGKVKIALTTTACVFGVVLLAFAIFMTVQYILSADDIVASMVSTTTFNPPQDYKERFARWETVLKEDGTSETVLVGVGHTTIDNALSDFLNTEIIEESTIQSQHHVANLDDFKAKLAADGTQQSRDLLYLIDAFESSGLYSDYNIGNVVIGLYANQKNEGTPMRLEAADGKWATLGGEKRSDGAYIVTGVAAYPVASKVGGGYVVTTQEQFTNVVRFKTNFQNAKLGIGTIQWTGGRFVGFIDYLENQRLSGGFDVTSADSRKLYDTKYMVQDLYSHTLYRIVSEQRYSASVEYCAGIIAGIYESPAASANFHYSMRSNPEKYSQTYLIDNAGSYELKSGKDFYDGTITDFSRSYTWTVHLNGRTLVYNTFPIAEAKRVKEAIDIYKYYYPD